MADVLIIGGGPAGLSAALALSRHQYKIIIFDNGSYRNNVQHMHNVLTWDHKPPADFRAAARADLARYNVQIIHQSIKTIRKTDTGFTADQYHGKKLVLACGRTDIYPDIAGYDACWGKSVFHCLFCHGYEERTDDSAGILAVGLLANPQMLLHVARMASQLARKIRVYTHGDETLKPFFKDKPVEFENRKIMRLSHDSGVRIHFEDDVVSEAFLVHIPYTKINGDFHIQLDLEMNDQHGMPCIKVSEPFKETSVSGCFAVGDICTAISSVPAAIQSGGACAGGLSPQLAELKSF